ncbi:tautomerase family protein [Pseudonocardia humida]|uniref:4-oxalocrotonate tautomerase n=1 Tax=Pseudonocardia humida TaxID=2800819 RepID=A0ABT1A1V8_9PSEU|nr:4-oxalocrotonate tautomerase [Pseudonocardia humida]MCO1656977.1 4-oxalocrotonate tautomerase [Pseudonocardia humida]
MPMLDVHIPAGALDDDAERELLATLTDIVLTWEGADPGDPAAQAAAWLFLHRPALVTVGGREPANPRYKVIATVPEGQWDPERRAGVVAAVTEAVLDAERGSRPRDPRRVWVFPTEVPEGTWGAGGQIHPLSAIADRLLGDPTAAAEYAHDRLRRARAERAGEPAEPVSG